MIVQPDSAEDREILVQHAAAYMMWGDIDKPFHLPECECDSCEAWRTAKNRPTHRELRGERHAPCSEATDDAIHPRAGTERHDDHQAPG